MIKGMTSTTPTASLPGAGPSRAAGGGMMSRLRGWFRAYRLNRDRRDAFANMLRLDDGILDDIGVTRDEVACAARQPLHVNASDVLQAARLARRTA